jgi:hypothetical protein
MRPEIDKYLNHGEFVAFPATHSSMSDVEHDSLEGEIPPDLKA